MILRALWSPLIDPYVSLTEEQRRLVMVRAMQTFDDEKYYIAKFMIHRNWWKDKNEFRLKIKMAVAMFILLFIIIIVIGGLYARIQSRPVLIFDIVMQMVDFTIPIILIGAFIGAFIAVFYWFIPWLVRPWMVEHVRRAICDLGYDEVCYRCGYRLTGLPWEQVQCPECGSVRDRPRPIPKREMDALTGSEDAVKI